jgi:hypothetical protein
MVYTLRFFFFLKCNLFHNSNVFGSCIIHILYIYSTNTGTEYFKHGIYAPFFPLQNAVCFIILTYLAPVLFTFYIQGVLKLKKNNSGAKRLIIKYVCQAASKPCWCPQPPRDAGRRGATQVAEDIVCATPRAARFGGRVEHRGNAAPVAHPHCPGFRSSAEHHWPVNRKRGPVLGRPQWKDGHRQEKSSNIQKSDCYQDMLLYVRATFIHNKEFCVLHVQSNTTIFYLLVQ